MAKKILIRGMLVMGLTFVAGAIYAQNAGTWSYTGGFEGNTSASFEPGPIADSWASGKIVSGAALAYLKLNYKRPSWDVSLRFDAHETSAVDSLFTVNWDSDMTGFLAETKLGFNGTTFSLAGLAAKRLTAWMYLLDRQLELRFLYKPDDDHDDEVFKIPTVDDTGEGLGKVGGSDGGFRLTVTPGVFYGALRFGTVMPIPLAAANQTLVFDQEFLLKSHLFAGYEEGPILFRGGYWLSPEGIGNSRTIGGVQVRNFPLRGISMSDTFRADYINDWEQNGTVSNTLKFSGIPIPGTKGLLVSHDIKYTPYDKTMWNKVEVIPTFQIGPVTAEPQASYEFQRYSNELKSGVTFTYSPVGGLTTKLKVFEEGIETQKLKTKNTSVLITPSLEFFRVIVSDYVGFQADAEAPISIDITDSSRNKTTLYIKPYLFFNLRKQSVGRDKDFNGEDNQIYLRYDLIYDFTKNEVSSAALKLWFKIVW